MRCDVFKYVCLVFEVQGRGNFPFDMLRYDSCCPDRSEDAAEMSGYDTEVRTVRLRRFARDKKAGPTVERWRSFGWSVVPGTPGEMPE